jgi:YD repeat-containing protein
MLRHFIHSLVVLGMLIQNAGTALLDRGNIQKEPQSPVAAAETAVATIDSAQATLTQPALETPTAGLTSDPLTETATLTITPSVTPDTPLPPESTTPAVTEEITGTPSPTETITPVDTATSTGTGLIETPTPSETPTPETSTPTQTPSLAPSPSPTVTLIPASATPTQTPTITLTPTPSPSLSLHAAPPSVLPGGVVNLQWQIENWQGQIKDISLLFTLPAGFTPFGPESGVYDPIASTQTIPVTATKGNLLWSVDENSKGPYNLQAAMLLSGTQLLTTALTIGEEALTHIETKGGEAPGLNGRVRVIFPANAANEPLEVRVRPSKERTRPPYSLSGQPFEITAERRGNGEKVDRFAKPLTIEIDYDESQLHGEETGLTLFYYDEKEGRWISLPSHVDLKQNRLIAQTDHLTNFDIDIQSWQAARLPGMEAFQVADFTGAATYSLPIWVPAGPAGLQPELSLQYNSQVVDSATANTQASWVGMGWSLDTGFIERDMNGTNDFQGDDTFSLVVGGMSSLLLPAEGDNGYFRTADETFWRIKYNSSADSWTVWDKQGTVYSFGDSPNSSEDDRAAYPVYQVVPGGCDFDGYRTWHWPLVEVKNVHNKSLKFTYTVEKKTTVYRDCSDNNQLTGVAVYPRTILYPHSRYRILFNRTSGRTDYDRVWDNKDFVAFYRTSSLSEIRIEQDADGNGSFEQLVKKYAFTYASSGHVFPNYTWTAGGKTLTLLKVQEFGFGGASSLPETTFTYSDGMHLTQATNGYGGQVVFTYEPNPWSEVNAPGSRTVNLTTSGAFTGLKKLEVPLAFAQPGGRYLVDAEIGRGSIHNTYAQVGIQEGNLAPQLQPIPGEYISGDPIHFYKYFYVNRLITLDYISSNSSKLWGVVYCTPNPCEINEFKLTTLPVRYRVTSKQISDGLGGSNTFSYRYDEPATNDTLHSVGAGTSDPYAPAYSQFRGHAMVQKVGPDGRITTTFFHQDDEKKGLPAVSIVSTQEYYTHFNAVDTTNWTPSSSNQTVARLAGDNALKNYNPDPDWDENITRVGNTLTNGETVFVQFRLKSGTDQAILALENTGSPYRRWGIKVSAGTLYSHYNNGSGEVNGTLLSGFQMDTWYVLQLGVDNQKFITQVWERDNPSPFYRFEFTMAANLAWHFRQWTKQGTVYLDSYSEGKLYSLTTNQYLTEPTPHGSLPAEDGHVPFTDLQILWPHLIQESVQTFEGDSEWTGRITQYGYDRAKQGNFQYGNQTDVIESYWDGDSYVKYRAVETRYYPFLDSSKYLAGLPGIQRQYRCPGNLCDYGAADLMGATWYLYDEASTYSAQPTVGKLAGLRTLLRCVNSACASTDMRFADQTYLYDSWGNVQTTRRFSNEGTYGVRATTVARDSTTIYDSVYGTYPVEARNPLYPAYPAAVSAYAAAKNYAFGGPSSLTDANGAVTSGEYDNFGRLTKIIRPGDSSTSPTMSFAYFDTASPMRIELRQRITGSTYTTIYHYYDGLGRLVQQQTVGAVLASGTKDVLVDSWYDGYGQRLEQTVPYEVNSGSYFHTRDGSKASTQTEYDVLGRPYREIATDGSFTEYNYSDLKVTRTDALGHATQFFLDDWGRTVQVIPPAGPGVTYTYDEADNLTQATRGGATTSLYYDKAGRKIEMDDPDMGNNWLYVYNAVNTLTQQTDARSCVISLTYDKLDRLTGKTYSGSGCTTPAVTYTYDAGTNGFGRRTGMADGSGSTAWLYDSRGRMTQETKVITGSGTFKTQWSYFSNDQIQWMKYPNGNGGAVYEMLSYTYHPQGTANTAASGAVNYVSGTDYDAAGRVDRRRLGGGTITVDYVYYGWTVSAGQGRLQQIKSGIASDLDSLQNLQYTYDLVGNVLAIADSLAGGTQTQTFTYDAAGRLSSAAAAGGSGGTYNQTYAYNATTGNLSSKGGTTYSYTDAAHKHAVSSTSAGSTFSYDANGSMTQRVIVGQTYNLTYDAENRLTGVSGAVTATFVYDGDGNRVKGTIGGVTTAYVGDYYEWTSSSNT